MIEKTEKPERAVENRKLSCFFVRELLALYVEDRLDRSRTNQVAEHLKDCKACSTLFERVKKSKLILNALSKTEPVPSLIEYVKREQYFWQEFFDKVGWMKWPSSLKWAVEVSGVALVLVVTIHVFPWLNLAKRMSTQPTGGPIKARNAFDAPPAEAPFVHGGTDITAANKPGEPRGDLNHAMEDLEPKTDVPEVRSGDEEAPPAMASADHPESVRAQPAPAPEQPEQQAPPALVVPQKEAVKVAAKTQTTEDVVANDDEVVAVSEGQRSGFLWRGSMKVSDLSDDLAEKITKKITDLGGTKAGQVELGWHRGNTRYYHFIMPDENYEKLLNLLNEDGIVELSKERHPRIIKSGYMRVILTLEESE